MPTDNATFRRPPGSSGPTDEEVRFNNRKRLAQRIGRLLAHIWLKRRRDAETLASPSDDSPTDDHAT